MPLKKSPNRLCSSSDGGADDGGPGTDVGTEGTSEPDVGGRGREFMAADDGEMRLARADDCAVTCVAALPPAGGCVWAATPGPALEGGLVLGDDVTGPAGEGAVCSLADPAVFDAVLPGGGIIVF